MEFETERLRARIREKYKRQYLFCRDANISENTLISKLNGRSGISRDDMIAWADLLDIPKSEFVDYFLTLKS